MSTNSHIKEKLSSTIQLFLSKFKISQNVGSSSFQFKSNPTVFNLESQVPEIWLRSKNPIDKNQIFYNFSTNLPKNSFPK